MLLEARGVDRAKVSQAILDAKARPQIDDALQELVCARHPKLMRETLGEHIHSYLVREKKIEWAEYNKTVSDWELKRYLPLM